MPSRPSPRRRERFQRGEVTLLWEIVYGVIGIAALLILYTIFANYGSFLLGGGSEQQALDSFNSLALDAAALASRPGLFSAIEQYPYTFGKDKYTLIGFDAGDEAPAQGIFCLTSRLKPKTCGSQACICLYDSTMNPQPGNAPQDHLQGLVSCRKIPGVATISSLREPKPLGGGGKPNYRGYNLGEERSSKPLIKNLAMDLQATEYLFIQHGEGVACTGKTTEGLATVVALYTNTPLYLDKTLIDGKTHLTIAPASPSTSQRMKDLHIRLGITQESLQRAIMAGDYGGAIRDSTAWIAAHDATDDAYPSVLGLQGRAFEQINQLPPGTAALLLSGIGEQVPLPDLASKQAGLLALRSYKESLTANNQRPRLSVDEQEFIVLSAIKLAERLKGYQPEIESALTPFFSKQATALSKTSPTAAFLQARQAARANAPDAVHLLTAYIQGHPDTEDTKEARFLLARIQEQQHDIRGAVVTLQSITQRHRPPEYTASDGTTISAPEQISRICTADIATADIYDVCSQILPGISCPQPDLVLLPTDACAPELVTERRCKATLDVAEAFAIAQNLAAKEGKTIGITSAYRTVQIQQRLYEDYKAKRGPAAAEPSCQAPHVTGGAIDVQFKGASMGSRPPNDMTSPDRQLLESIMCRAGFTRWKDEYWHYEIGTKRALAHPAHYPTICSAP